MQGAGADKIHSLLRCRFTPRAVPEQKMQMSSLWSCAPSLPLRARAAARCAPRGATRVGAARGAQPAIHSLERSSQPAGTAQRNSHDPAATRDRRLQVG